MKRLFFLISFLIAGCSSVGEFFPETGKFLSDHVPGIRSSEEFEVSEGNDLLYSNADEYRIGRGVSAVLLGMYKPLPSEKKQEFLNKVGQSIVRFSDRPDLYKGYRFILVESDQINAMAAPNGMIFISTGLFDLINDEDTLAAVMAHEISHVVHRHGIKSLAEGQSVNSTTSGGEVVAALDCSGASQLLTAGFSVIVGDIVATLLEKGYSREQEYEADKDAAELLAKAGYNPAALKRLFKLLQQAKKDSGGWFSTHPSPEDRIEALNIKLTPLNTSEPVRTDRFQKVAEG